MQCNKCLTVAAVPLIVTLIRYETGISVNLIVILSMNIIIHQSAALRESMSLKNGAANGMNVDENLSVNGMSTETC